MWRERLLGLVSLWTEGHPGLPSLYTETLAWGWQVFVRVYRHKAAGRMARDQAGPALRCREAGQHTNAGGVSPSRAQCIYK